jgi:hypothetical protein
MPSVCLDEQEQQAAQDVFRYRILMRMMWADTAVWIFQEYLAQGGGGWGQA